MATYNHEPLNVTPKASTTETVIEAAAIFGVGYVIGYTVVSIIKGLYNLLTS